MSDNQNLKASRGLGRGLSSLLGDISPQINEAQATNVSHETSIALLSPNPNQPRKMFDKDELETLAQTIKEHGIVQPLLVRPNPNKPNEYTIVAGERRWRAAQLAGLHKVPVVIKELDDLEMLKIGIVENLQRADLNPIEEALAFEQLMDRFGYNQQTIADSVGKSRSYIANTLRLLGLDKEVQEMVIDGRLSAGHARAALATDNPTEAARKMVATGMNVREAEKLANRPSNSKNVNSKLQDPDSLALAGDLTNSLGMQVDIQNNGNAGKISIKYNNLEQLDEICRLLSGQ